ncbi:MAG TPA: hypothetical protein EYP56_06920 [Planctomycetaceae bacterium]|nr:hypothetical protein [Planctomycetaceae bacterium]HIQ20951.1 hypothetical protein [Planctomycetota bacterium]
MRTKALWAGLILALGTAAAIAVVAISQKRQAERPPAVRCLAFAPDSGLLAAAVSDQLDRGALVVWGVEACKPRWVHREPFGFASVALSPDVRLVVAAGSRGVALWPWLTGGEPEIILDRASGHRGGRCVALSPDARWLATGGSGRREIRVWDAATGRGVCPDGAAAGAYPTVGLFSRCRAVGHRPLGHDDPHLEPRSIPAGWPPALGPIEYSVSGSAGVRPVPRGPSLVAEKAAA